MKTQEITLPTIRDIMEWLMSSGMAPNISEDDARYMSELIHRGMEGDASADQSLIEALVGDTNDPELLAKGKLLAQKLAKRVYERFFAIKDSPAEGKPDLKAADKKPKAVKTAKPKAVKTAKPKAVKTAKPKAVKPPKPKDIPPPEAQDASEANGLPPTPGSTTPPPAPISTRMGVRQAMVLKQLIAATPEVLDPEDLNGGGLILDSARNVFLSLSMRGACRIETALRKKPSGRVQWTKIVLAEFPCATDLLNDYIAQHPEFTTVLKS